MKYKVLIPTWNVKSSAEMINPHYLSWWCRLG